MGVRFVLAEHKIQLKKKTLTRDQVRGLKKACKRTVLASDLSFLCRSYRKRFRISFFGWLLC
jgi:hypothetical protein